MNKKLWVGGYLLSAAIFFAALVAEVILGILMIDEVVNPATLATAMVTIGVLAYLQFMIVHMVMTLSVLYSIWNVLQDGVTQVSPGKAIGFLFIPFYNIYWMFRVWAGYPKEYNDYIDRHRLSAPRLTSTVFTIFPIVILLSALLILPLLILPFVTIFAVARACDAVNNLLLARSAAEHGRVPAPSEFIGTDENPRSRTPIFALGGVALVGAMIVFAFGVFAWFNLFPKPSDEIVPAKAGNYLRQPGGKPSGSILGGRSYFWNYIYVSDEGGNKKALNYNASLFGSDAEPKRWIESMCSSHQSTVLRDASGKEAGKYCTDSEAIFLQHGNNTLRLYAPGNYELDKIKAKPASSLDMVAFAKELPWLKGIDFGELPTTASTTYPDSTTASLTGAASVAKDAQADLAMTGDEFYNATKGKPASALKQFAGKVVQITARMYSSTSGSVMLMSGKNTFWARFEPSEANAFSEGKEGDRLVIKCMAEVKADVTLERCTLIENKKILTADDTPDFTYTADEFWRTVASYDLPSSTRSAKWDELRGKIIKISGNVKAMGGDKSYLAAGTNNSIPCKPDEENREMFDALTEGQSVTFLSVHGVASLEHCIVVRN